MGSGSDRILLWVSMGCSFLQSALAWGPSWAANGFCFTMVLHGLQGNNFLHPGLLHGLQGNLGPEARSASSLLFSFNLAIYRAVSRPFFHSSTAGFWKILSQRHWKHCLSSTVSCRRSPGSDFNLIEPAVPGTGQPLSSFLRWRPWTSATANTWTHKTNTNAGNKDHRVQQQNLLRSSAFFRGVRPLTELSLFLLLCF